METFGNRLRIARMKKELTLEELAEILKTTKATLSRYENNKRTPDVYVVRQLSKVLEVDLNYLINGEEEIETIAAHKEGEEFTEDELKDIEEFKNFVRSKRNKEWLNVWKLT